MLVCKAPLMTESIREAQLKKTEAGLIPQGEGWFVVNARDVSWIQSEERGQDTDFEGEQEWSQLDSVSRFCRRVSGASITASAARRTS